MKKGLSRIKMGIRALVGVVGGYLGVISTILGTIFGILASILVVGLIAGICVYVKVIPMFTEAREVVFDNLVNMTEEDFVMNEDTLVFDDKGKNTGFIQWAILQDVPSEKRMNYTTKSCYISCLALMQSC